MAFGKALNDLLEENNICHIDFLSVDVEGTEMDVLLGIDLRKYRPKLILLEDKHVYLTKHRYLTKQDYVLVKKKNKISGTFQRGKSDHINLF